MAFNWGLRDKISDTIRDTALADWPEDVPNCGSASINDMHGEELRVFALRALSAAEVARREAQRQIEWMADEARNAGATWQQVGEALGISKQAAQQRLRTGR